MYCRFSTNTITMLFIQVHFFAEAINFLIDPYYLLSTTVLNDKQTSDKRANSGVNSTSVSVKLICSKLVEMTILVSIQPQ